MPVLEIVTNVPRGKISAAVLADLSKALAATIKKPEQYCMVRVVPDQLMMFGGSNEPCGYMTLMSIGHLGVVENKEHSSKIFQFIEKHLGISGSRMYIRFDDKPSSEVGFQGTTFHDILG